MSRSILFLLTLGGAAFGLLEAAACSSSHTTPTSSAGGAESSSSSTSTSSSGSGGGCAPGSQGGTFVVGVDLGGTAVTIGGHAYLADADARAKGMTTNANASDSNVGSVALVPPVDPDTTELLESTEWVASPASFTLEQPVANGSYQVWVWVRENEADHARSITLALEGNVVAQGLGDLLLGHWQKAGPYAVTVADGKLTFDVSATKGNPALAGFEIDTAPVPGCATSGAGGGSGTGGAATGGSGTGGGDAGAPACKTRGEQLGMNQYLSGDATVAGMTLDGIASFGVTWARLYWAWPYSQPSSSSPGNYTPVKQIAGAAHMRGLKLLVVATGAPGWANGNGGDNAPPDDAHIPDFAAFEAGVAQADVDAVEVWNEPNNAGFWTGTLDPVRMAKMQIAAYQAIKAAAPNVPVITGGLTQVPYQPQDYFKAMLAVSGFAHSFDGVGLHPYLQPGDPLDTTLTPPNILMVQTPAIHQMLVSAGVGNTPFWYTEFGTPTGGPGSVTEAQQATIYTHYFQGFDMLRAQGISFGINFVYEMQDWSTPNPSSEEPYFGLLHADGSDKPAAPVVRSYAKLACN